MASFIHCSPQFEGAPCLFKNFRDQCLEVVLPSRYKLDFAAELVNQKRKWIEKHLRVLPAANPAAYLLPQEIDLALVSEHWKITYLFSPLKLVV